ncbi:MAG TPA: PAS domain S-box protein [Candidatus Angelobacter sp.]|nr:PAS domain S-box protein [Candidatus Angelobacter sp.]
MESKQETNGEIVPLAPEYRREPQDAILDMAFAAFVEVDSESLITDWNQRAESTFGWPRTLAIGRPLGALIIPPDQRDAYDQTVRNFFALQAGPVQSQRIEIAALHRDGHVFPIELSAFATPWGRAYRMAAFMRDISRRQIIDQEAEKRHRAIMDQLAEPYHEVDLRGNYTYLNKPHCEIYGISSSSDRLGVNFRAFFRPEDIKMFHEIYHQVYLTGEPARHEYPITVPNGELVFSEQSVFLRKDAQGNRIGFMVFTRDCTKRKQNEIELAKAKKAAETASRAKSEFLANVSHEIRTPLNGVIGMLELANSTGLTSDQRELLGLARDSAETLLEIVNDILDFSKIEAGKLQLERAEFDLAKIVAEVMRIAAIRASQKNLELTCEVVPGIPRLLLGDGGRLTQVLSNLVGNAVKFTALGKVTLRVESVEAQAGAGDQARLKFSVYDTGIGIPREKQKLIFEAFSQADASTTRKYGGTGLGLAISLRIVKSMGGEIWVESDAGRGSAFHFTANFALGQVPAPGSTAENQTELLGFLCR